MKIKKTLLTIAMVAAVVAPTAANAMPAPDTSQSRYYEQRPFIWWIIGHNGWCLHSAQSDSALCIGL